MMPLKEVRSERVKSQDTRAVGAFDKQSSLPRHSVPKGLDVCHPHPCIRPHSSPLSPHIWSLTLLTFTFLFCSLLLLSLSAEADQNLRAVWPCKMGALRPNLYMHCVFLVLSIPKHGHNCTVVDKHNMPCIFFQACGMQCKK